MLAALLVTLSQMSVVTGHVYAMQISLCIEKKDAIAILDAEKTLATTTPASSSTRSMAV